MARGEIEIDETLCKGCEFCIKFCNRGCLVAAEDRFTPLGRPLPVFAHPENCNACAVCAWMCPDFAIEVFRWVPAQSASR